MSTLDAAANDYESFSVNLRTEVATQGIWLCIAQLRSRTKDAIAADESCPANVEVLAELLRVPDEGGKPLLIKQAQPGQIPLVVCPEYAFGSSDWVKIDELVKAFPDPLVLLVGFGQCALAGLSAIRGSAGESIRWSAR